MKYEAAGLPAEEVKADVLRLWDLRAARQNDALFRWAYLKNPIAPGRCFLLRARDGEATENVGTVGVGNRRVSAGGEPATAGVLGDFFVVKNHRTFFPALTMQKAVLAWARKSFDVVYGFPNENARPIIKRLGFHEYARLERHVLVLRHQRYIASRLGSTTRIARIGARLLALPVDASRQYLHPRLAKGPSRGLTFERVTRLDERFDRLFARHAFPYLTVGVRDAKLLQWRFLDRPDQECEVHALSERSGELLAYVVVNVMKANAHVRDLLGRDVELMGEALRLVAGAMHRRGCASLSFNCAAPYAFQRQLDDLGFRIREAGQGPRLYGHAGDHVTNARLLSSLDRWYVTEADEDQ